MKEKKPKKCCFNCYNAMKYSVPREDHEMYDHVIKFNETRRLCGDNYRMPSYNAFELRHCKGFCLEPERQRREDYVY